GRKAVAIEFDRRRQAAADEVFEAICTLRPQLAVNCELVPGRFPDVIVTRDVGRSIAVVTNFVATTSEGLLQSMLEGFSRYAAVLIDIDRFIEKRETDEQ